jgi:hypothetical protein
MIEGQLYVGELVAWWCRSSTGDHKYLTVGVVASGTTVEQDRVLVRTMFDSVVRVARADLIRAPFVLASDVVQSEPYRETPRDPLADFPVGSFVVWTENGKERCGVVTRDGRLGIRTYDNATVWPTEYSAKASGLRLCDPVKENRIRVYKIDPASWLRLIEGSLTGHATEVRVEGGSIPPDAVFVNVTYGRDTHLIYMAHPTFSPVNADSPSYPHGGKITVTISKGDTEDA